MNSTNLFITSSHSFFLVKKRLSRDIYIFGLVSFLTDISSEMIFSVFGLFLGVMMGVSAPLIGLIEGFADTSASLLEVFSGYVSDKFKNRKTLVVLGYGLSTLAKILLPFATTVRSLFAFRTFERFGKGIRTAPRDAMISSVAQKSNRGLAFGFHRALDTSGAILGPLIAYGLLARFGQTLPTFKTLFSIAAIPAALAVVALLFGIKNKPIPTRKPLAFKNIRFSSQYKRYLFTYGLFSLSYFSFAFLLLRAYTLGFAIKDVILLYLVYNIVFAVTATPIGALSDKLGRKTVLASGFFIYALLCIGFAFATTKTLAVLLFALYGIFLAIDEGVGRAFAADLTTPATRATAMGALNTVTGVIYLPASLIAGLLWKISPATPFLAAAGIAGFALLSLLVLVD